jgi:hypothetical protein
MVSRRPNRSTLAGLIVLAAALPVLATVVAGCGKKDPTKVVPPLHISRQDSNDIVQHIAATVAADGGGWYFLVKAICDTLSHPVLPGETPPASPPHQMYQLTKSGTIVYNFEIVYYDTSGRAQARRDSATSRMDAIVHANNGTLNINGVDGTYGYHADTSFVVNIKYGAPSDTIEFDNIVEDSTFANVTSQFDMNSHRLWFHEDDFFDYTLYFRRDQLTANPYPLAGSEVSWLIDAFPMGSPVRTDHSTEVLAEFTMTFDGTNQAIIQVFDTVADDQAAYKYKLNLDTGQLTALN